MTAFLKISGSLLVLAVLIIFCRVQGSFFPWFLLYFYTALLIYEACTVLFALRGIDASRRVSAIRLSSGQSLDVHLTLFHQGAWPLFWARVTVDFPKRWMFHALDAERWIVPLWRREVELDYRIQSLSRGVYLIGDTRVETGDLFGIVRRTIEIADHTEIIVYPRVVPVRGWSARRPEEIGMREPTRLRTEESTNVLGVRNYVPGDRLNRIHWPASARQGTLLSKEFELHVSSELMFLPDLSSQTHKDLPEITFELEMTIAASLMKYSYEMRRRFAMTLHGKELTQYPAGVDEALFLRCMEGLATAQGEGRVPFGQTLVRVANELPRGTTLVVISPFITRDAAIAAETCSHRVHIDWFVPLGAKTIGNRERAAVRMLQAARSNVHLISSADQLSDLGRGGAHLVNGTR